jgi:hypothetical protein
MRPSRMAHQLLRSINSEQSIAHINFFYFIFNRLHYKTDIALKLANSPGGGDAGVSTIPCQELDKPGAMPVKGRFPRCALLAEDRIQAA